MIMRSPTPYGAATLNNSPLAPDGSDFPCKQRAGVYDAAGVSNVMPIGAPQTLAFKGEAVHGGGSCQISLTKDLKPTKDSKWMVIHSIEGGCPAKADGNLGENPDSTSSASTFKYSIPQGIAAGQYTLAWTWFNRLGNREMYMNCAPVTVTGGSKKRDIDGAQFSNATDEFDSDEIFKRDASFPDMYRANIDADCRTQNQTEKDLKFPTPGTSVEKAGDPGNLDLAPACGDKMNAGFSNGSSGASSSAGASGSSPSAASGSGSSSGSGTASSAAGAAPAPSSIVAIPPPSASGMGMASAAVSVASAAQSVASAAASVASGAGMVSPATATGSASSGSSGSGSGSDSGSTPSSSGSASSGSSSSLSGTAGGGAAAAAPGSMPCSSPGQTVCSSDGMKFGTCDTNKMAVMMAVASGTKCSGGQIAAAGTQKRSAKFARLFNA